MKRFITVSVLALAVLLIAAASLSDAWGRHGGGRLHHFGGRSPVFIGVGPWWGGPPYPYWWWDYPQPYYYGSPVVEQEPTASWYYCASARAYYPTVPSCPEPWIQGAGQPLDPALIR